MTYIIYKITNSITGKSYVGYTKHSIEKRWEQHIKRAYNGINVNTKFYNSIRKHGREVWTIEIVENVDSAETAKHREIHHIEVFDTYFSGYNSTKGGDGNNGIIMSDESNKARSEKLKGIPKNYVRMLGKKHREDSKSLISASHTGMKKPWVKWSEEQIIKRAMTRRSLSKEQYDQIIEMKSLGKTLKNISIETGIDYDIVKKWSNRRWDL
jgi:group I intron endonuclease